MKVLQYILAFGLIIIGLILLIIPLLYWIKNPEKTEMEIFILFWYCQLIGVVGAGIGLYILKR